MPKGRMSSANSPKQTTVMPALASSASQNPSRGSSSGNARNIGRVGRTYQKVCQAWLAIFSGDCFSRYSQISVRRVMSGSAAMKPPSLSLRLATSDTSTTMAAVSTYLVMIQDMGFSRTSRSHGRVWPVLRWLRRKRNSEHLFDGDVFAIGAQGEFHRLVGAVSPEPAVLAVERGDQFTLQLRRRSEEHT